jgi:hypothetical protein
MRQADDGHAGQALTGILLDFNDHFFKPITVQE